MLNDFELGRLDSLKLENYVRLLPLFCYPIVKLAKNIELAKCTNSRRERFDC